MWTWTVDTLNFLYKFCHNKQLLGRAEGSGPAQQAMLRWLSEGSDLRYQPKQRFELNYGKKV